MKTAEGLRGEVMVAAFAEAIAGRPDRLFVQLGIQSGLPGTRMNIPLAQAFAVECVGRGKGADKLVLAMALLTDEAAPGASEREFLPVCGVLALGARAAHSKDAALIKKAMTVLHHAADDHRFRVREIVPIALSRMGAVLGDALVHELGPWMDGYFHASAALLAMAQPNFLPTIEDVNVALAHLDTAYDLARNAPRSASRYPGRKALVDALAVAPAAFATRFGVKVFDHLVRWANTEMPELRAAIETNLRTGNLATRYAVEIKRVRAALDASLPPPRDPTLAVQGMRGRGKKRSRR